MKFRVLFVLFLAVLLTISASGASAQERSYDLKYRLEPGREFSVLNMHISHQNFKTPAGIVGFGSLTRDLMLDYRVVAADEAGMTLEATYRKKLYRNTDREGKVAVTDFAAILGRSARYMISPTGVLSQFQGFAEMPPVRMPSGGNYTGAFLQEEIEHLFLTLPDKPVAKGETWTRKAFGVDIAYTLVDEVRIFGRDCVRIFARIQEENPLSKAKDRNGNELTVETTEPYTDIYYFDYKEGMMVYRFSVASHAQRLFKNAAGEVVNHQVFDVLYETFVTLGPAAKRGA